MAAQVRIQSANSDRGNPSPKVKPNPTNSRYSCLTSSLKAGAQTVAAVGVVAILEFGLIAAAAATVMAIPFTWPAAVIVGGSLLAVVLASGIVSVGLVWIACMQKTSQRSSQEPKIVQNHNKNAQVQQKDAQVQQKDAQVQQIASACKEALVQTVNNCDLKNNQAKEINKISSETFTVKDGEGSKELQLIQTYSRDIDRDSAYYPYIFCLAPELVDRCNPKPDFVKGESESRVNKMWQFANGDQELFFIIQYLFCQNTFNEFQEGIWSEGIELYDNIQKITKGLYFLVPKFDLTQKMLSRDGNNNIIVAMDAKMQLRDPALGDAPEGILHTLPFRVEIPIEKTQLDGQSTWKIGTPVFHEVE